MLGPSLDATMSQYLQARYQRAEEAKTAAKLLGRLVS